MRRKNKQREQAPRHLVPVSTFNYEKKRMVRGTEWSAHALVDCFFSSNFRFFSTFYFRRIYKQKTIWSWECFLLGLSKQKPNGAMLAQCIRCLPFWVFLKFSFENISTNPPFHDQLIEWYQMEKSFIQVPVTLSTISNIWYNKQCLIILHRMQRQWKEI